MSFLSPGTGSLAIAVVQCVFAWTVWSTACNPKSQVPRRASATTATGLWLIATIFLCMGPLWAAALSSSAGAAGWTFIAIFRPVVR